MRLLAESSAVVTWLLNEPRSAEIARILGNAREIITSTLTWIECDRVLHRSATLNSRPFVELEDSKVRLDQASRAWVSVELTAECQLYARGNFPIEPIRTLDALHLATALVVRDWGVDLQILSLDQRVRDNARALQFAVLPA